MCADKLRKTMPVKVTFVEGEIPPADKFTTLSEQPRNALTIVEKAIGDIWNQNGDELLTDNFPLQIPNLGRMIGQATNLNPVIVAPQGQTEFRFYDHIGERYAGLSTGRCLFPITGAPSADGGSTNLTNWEANLYDVSTVGDWHVDSDGNLSVHGVLDSTDIIYYTVTVADMDFDDTYLFNVIPNVNQDAFTGCRVSLDAGNYVLHLPPRRPVASHGLDRWLSAAEIADSDNTSGATVPYVLYQDTVSGVAHEFYRHPMPKEIRDGLSGLSTGDAFPAGFMYLYNTTTNTIIEDVVFTKRATNPEFEIGISSATFDFSSYASSDELAATYNASPFVLITVGASITSVLSNLVTAFMTQDSSTRAVLRHDQLDHPNPSYADSNDFQPGPSFVQNDDHIYLLSRYPLTDDASGSDRDPNKNAMLDDLIMGCSSIADATPGKYVDPVAETGVASTKIFFKGSTTAFPYIYCPATSDGDELLYKANAHLFSNSNSPPVPKSLAHIWAGDSGQTSSSSNSFLTIENNGQANINILTPSANQGAVYFGDENDATVGWVLYDHFAEELIFGANNTNRISVFSDGKVGIGGSSATTDSLLHVWAGSAGSITPDSDTVATIEKDGHAYLQLLAENNSGILFGGDASGISDSGRIIYNVSEQFDFYMNSAHRAKLTDSGFSIRGDGIPPSPSYALEVWDNASASYTANFFNDGNNVDRYGIRIQAGLDSPSIDSDITWMSFNDGNGSAIAVIEYKAAGNNIDFAAASDSRLKKNITCSHVDGLQIITQIPLRQFDWLDENKPHQDIWYVAQEVEEVYPHMVSTGPDGYKMVSDKCLIPVLVKAIQQQQKQIEELKFLINS